jgi:DNA-binding transcriptional regulator YiaG
MTKPSAVIVALVTGARLGEGRGVQPDDIKGLRADLACTAKELAQALGIEQSTVLAWEKGDLFPTKAFITKMEQLRARGPAAIPKKAKGSDPLKVLADPALWELVRKLVANKKLRDEVVKLAAAYPDPAQDPKE